MGAGGWIIAGIIVVVLLFVISSTETQDKVIDKSGILSDFLKSLQGVKGESSDYVLINNVNYTRVDMVCSVDDNCDFLPECLNNCECREGSCYRQVPVGG